MMPSPLVITKSEIARWPAPAVVALPAELHRGDDGRPRRASATVRTGDDARDS